jgi:hypothetical protein
MAKSSVGRSTSNLLRPLRQPYETLYGMNAAPLAAKRSYRWTDRGRQTHMLASGPVRLRERQSTSRTWLGASGLERIRGDVPREWRQC